MKELFLKQEKLFTEDRILITYFSYENKGEILYRIYAKNLITKELIDPKENSSKFSSFKSLEEALIYITSYIETL